MFNRMFYLFIAGVATTFVTLGYMFGQHVRGAEIWDKLYKGDYIGLDKTTFLKMLNEGTVNPAKLEEEYNK